MITIAKYPKRSLIGASLRGLGASEDTVAAYTPPVWLGVVYRVAGAAGTIAGAYHGYKRFGSAWGAVGWGLLGGMFWPISIPIAFAQGYAKPKKGR
jgi:hypothetical protein